MSGYTIFCSFTTFSHSNEAVTWRGGGYLLDCLIGATGTQEVTQPTTAQLWKVRAVLGAGCVTS